MFVNEVTVQNQVGLHARPATFFIQKANEFKSSIWVEKKKNDESMPKVCLGYCPLELLEGHQFVLLQTVQMKKRLLTAW